MASAVGLFQPVPPSPYLTPLMVMGSKNVGAAEVARAASLIRAEKASSVSVLYVRMRWAAAPAPRVRMAMTKTKVLFVLGASKSASGSNFESVMTFLNEFYMITESH